MSVAFYERRDRSVLVSCQIVGQEGNLYSCGRAREMIRTGLSSNG